MFSFKSIKPLIFDEFPYKKYMVKCAQPPQLKYLCFDKYEFRIYKGEGTVQLVAYYPFAFSVVSPSLAYSGDGAVINNSGDMPANIEIVYNLQEVTGDIDLTLQGADNQDTSIYGILKLKGVTKEDSDTYMSINTQTQLIEGLDSNKQKTGKLYNKYIDAGDFFWPPVGRSRLISSRPFVSAQYTPLFY